MTETHPASDILKLNAWMQEYANRVNVIYADYFTALVDDKGWLKDPDSADGLHPNADGYKVMAPIAAAAIEKAFH
jgi:lysophospholipase L1-like esterase